MKTLELKKSGYAYRFATVYNDLNKRTTELSICEYSGYVK